MIEIWIFKPNKSNLFTLIFDYTNVSNKVSKEATYGIFKINLFTLNCCPPYTEIFSKRRKIYSVCVEGLSMINKVTASYVKLRNK